MTDCVRGARADSTSNLASSYGLVPLNDRTKGGKLEVGTEREWIVGEDTYISCVDAHFRMIDSEKEKKREAR